MTEPLGDHPLFKAVSGQQFSWGPDGRSTASFAGRVVDDLAAGINRFADQADQGRGFRFILPSGAAIGCVPWFGSDQVADALLRLDHLCVVTGKPAVGRSLSRAVQRIAGKHIDQGLAHRRFPLESIGLDELAPMVDGERDVVGPVGDWPGSVWIDPVRVAGWREGRDRGPLLHAKLLVLGDMWHREDDYGYERWGFSPRVAWFGSANWTHASSTHLELGLWTDDKNLITGAMEFLKAVIRLSEPVGSTAPAPTPEMAELDWDDDAFRDYLTDG